MTHQLENLRIHAFRQLRGIEFHDLGRVNLLVGVNNSGKTSVLEAIAAHCRPLEPLHWLSIARHREIKSSREPTLDSVRWLFPQRRAQQEDPYYRGEVRIESTGKYVNIETTARYEGIVRIAESFGTGSYDEDDEGVEQKGRTIFSNTTTTTPAPSPPGAYERGANISLAARVAPNQSLLFETESNELCEEHFRLWEGDRYVSKTTSSEPNLPVTTISPIVHRVLQVQLGQLSEATLKGRKFSVVEAVQLIDTDIEDLEILSRTGIRPTLYVQHKRTGFTPISVLGDGVRRVLAIASTLGTVQHGILLIDEIETAIHKDALASIFHWLIRACKYFEVQLFITTHSLEAIDALLTSEIDEPNEIVAFHLPECGKGQIKRFDGDILDNLRIERDLDIR